MEPSVAQALLFAHSAFAFREEQLRATMEELRALKSSYATLQAEVETLKTRGCQWLEMTIEGSIVLENRATGNVFAWPSMTYMGQFIDGNIVPVPFETAFPASSPAPEASAEAVPEAVPESSPAPSEEAVPEAVAEAVAESSPAPSEEAVAEAVPAEKKNPSKLARIFASLSSVLTDGTKLSLTGLTGRWEGTFANGKLAFQGKVFNSPYAVACAHASVITDSHPKPTKPGNGWIWIKIEDGPYAKKTLAQAYDAYFSAHFSA
jgi:hypothetical protein